MSDDARQKMRHQWSWTVYTAAQAAGMGSALLTGKGRTADVVKPRRALATFLRERGLSYPDIGAIMERDHTTIIHSVRAADIEGDAVQAEVMHALRKEWIKRTADGFYRPQSSEPIQAPGLGESKDASFIAAMKIAVSVSGIQPSIILDNRRKGREAQIRAALALGLLEVGLGVSDIAKALNMTDEGVENTYHSSNRSDYFMPIVFDLAGKIADEVTYKRPVVHFWLSRAAVNNLEAIR